MILCCLCRTELKKDKKKKKLHNQACAEEKKLLERFLQSLHEAELSDFEETRGDDAWLCYSCQSELRRLEKLRSTVESLEKHLGDLSKNLHIVEPARGEGFVRKRPPAGRTSSPKVFRTQVEHVSAELSRQPTESPQLAVSNLCICLILYKSVNCGCVTP